MTTEPPGARILPCGPRAVLVEVANAVEVAGLHRWLDGFGLPGLEVLVPAARTVLVRTAAPLESVADAVAGWRPEAEVEVERSTSPEDVVEIPTVYDGADLEAVAESVAMPVDEVITRHSAPTYTAAFCGFSPGFAYLVGGDPGLRVARRNEPRTRVPAGTVAIGGEFCAVYPSASPGGWQLLGSALTEVWNVDRPAPALIVPGARVRFIPVQPGSAPARRAAHAERDATPTGARYGLEVLVAGPLATVQDDGRRGFEHLGVGRSGAADPDALGLGNRLVGNKQGTAAIEVTLGGLEVVFLRAALIALTGAPAVATVHGGPPVGQGAPVALPAGARLTLGPPREGLRTYLCVRGGIGVPPVLGSRSTDTLGGLGPPPLGPGDLLVVGDDPGTPIEVDVAPQPRRAQRVRVWPGPRGDWFTGGLAALSANAWRVQPDSNRVGVRLTGPPLRRARDDELPSEGMVEGAVQVPHDGQPIVMLADHPVTGGYPVVAVVDPADLGIVAQARPGDALQFVSIH